MTYYSLGVTSCNERGECKEAMSRDELLAWSTANLVKWAKLTKYDPYLDPQIIGSPAGTLWLTHVQAFKKKNPRWVYLPYGTSEAKILEAIENPANWIGRGVETASPIDATRCSKGYRLVPGTNRCERDRYCNTGAMWDERLQKCVPLVPPPPGGSPATPPPGAPAGTPACPAGYFLYAGQCWPNSPATTHPLPIPPTGAPTNPTIPPVTLPPANPAIPPATVPAAGTLFSTEQIREFLTSGSGRWIALGVGGLLLYKMTKG